jgi:hypothetical protein
MKITMCNITMSDSFKWDASSAFRKATSDCTFGVSVGVVATKTTAPHDPQRDAYRSCSNCHKHINYHKDGKCPK